MAEHDRDEHGGRNGAEHERIPQELRALLDALALRAEEFLLTRCGHDGAGPSAHGDAFARAETTGRCAACPLCAALALLRGERPEPSARLLEQLAALLAELRRALADDRSFDSGDPSGGGAGDVASDGQEAPPNSTSDRVQHIGVRRVRGKVMDHAAAPDRTSTG